MFNFKKDKISQMKQEELFQLIKSKLPGHISLSEHIAGVLGISSDSAYRRIRGETALTFEEAGILMTEINSSIQWPSISMTATTSFIFSDFTKTEKFLIGYLKNLLKELNLLKGKKDALVTYAAEDLPLFHHFYFEEHTAFKLYYWMRSVMGIPEFENGHFDLKIINPEIMTLCKDLLAAYRSIPSIELWSESQATSTLKQVRYYWESGYFKDKKDALLVCEQMIDTFEILKKQAEAANKLPDGKKELEDNGSFSLYQSEIEIGNNCILVTTENQSTTYLRHQTFNYLSTSDPAFCESTSRWIGNLIKKSILISGVSEKKRQQFFGKMKEDFHLLVKEIK